MIFLHFDVILISLRLTNHKKLLQNKFFFHSVQDEFTEQLNYGISRIITSIEDTFDLKNGTIHAKITLQQGLKLGPYPIKWTNEPIDQNVAWKV